MTDPTELALAIADMLPAADSAKNELVALGMVTTGIICELAPEERSKVVDRFCETLRISVATQLN